MLSPISTALIKNRTAFYYTGDCSERIKKTEETKKRMDSTKNMRIYPGKYVGTMSPGFAQIERAICCLAMEVNDPMNMMLKKTRLAIVALAGLLFLPVHAQAPAQKSALLNPDDPEMNRRAPNLFVVRLETSKGVITIEVHRDWAPHGVDRFYNLVRAGYYDQARFFRVIKGKWAQFGVHGDPKISNVWRTRTIPDDPRRESNYRGTIAFAFAEPNGRASQVFINLQDNSATHDKEPFAPFGKIVEGMDVADSLNAEYGETSGGGIRRGKQAPLFEGGNDWLRENFPRLDYITRATVVKR
jgi:cyclophilin family peptidyl-prolyl cis-trans isomerase